MQKIEAPNAETARSTANRTTATGSALSPSAVARPIVCDDPPQNGPKADAPTSGGTRRRSSDPPEAEVSQLLYASDSCSSRRFPGNHRARAAFRAAGGPLFQRKTHDPPEHVAQGLYSNSRSSLSRRIHHMLDDVHARRGLNSIGDNMQGPISYMHVPSEPSDEIQRPRCDIGGQMPVGPSEQARQLSSGRHTPHPSTGNHIIQGGIPAHNGINVNGIGGFGSPSNNISAQVQHVSSDGSDPQCIGGNHSIERGCHEEHRPFGSNAMGFSVLSAGKKSYLVASVSVLAAIAGIMRVSYFYPALFHGNSGSHRAPGSLMSKALRVDNSDVGVLAVAAVEGQNHEAGVVHDGDPTYVPGQDFLQSNGGAVNKRVRGSKRVLVAHGSGPEFTGLTGKAVRFGNIPPQGVTWYRVLESSKFQWRVAPHHWNLCTRGENVFLGDTGFTFDEPDPHDPTAMKSKYLRFRLERRDDRRCLWNFSKACLAGGNFIMNLGRKARDMHDPGDYALKTGDGVIRIVAHNINRPCTLKISSKLDLAGSPHRSDQGPLDYLRHVVSSTTDPELCQEWMRKRESEDDLFLFNSDLALVHVDTPWMRIVLQVRQNKVATAETCAFASMNIFVSDMTPEFLEDDFHGVLGTQKIKGAARRTSGYGNGKVYEVDGNAHEVDGPFRI